MSYLLGFDSFHKFSCMRKCRFMSESYKNLFNLLIFSKASKFKRLFYYFRKILFAVRFLFNIFYSVPSYDISRIYAVFIGVSWTHKAVGCHKDTARKIVKLLLLILPCTAEIADKMFVFLKPIIAVRRKHFTVCIYINAKSFCLL